MSLQDPEEHLNYDKMVVISLLSVDQSLALDGIVPLKSFLERESKKGFTLTTKTDRKGVENHQTSYRKRKPVVVYHRSERPCCIWY